MSLFSNNFESFGLDISDLSLKAVAVGRSGNKQIVRGWNETAVPEGIIDKGNITDEEKAATLINKCLTKPRGRLGTNHVVVSLPETKSFIKLIHIEREKLENKKKKEDQHEVIAEHLAKHVPVSVEDLQLDWLIAPGIHKDDSKVDVLVGAVPKTVIRQYSSLIKKAHLIPVAFEIEAQSIVRALFPKVSIGGALISQSNLGSKLHVPSFLKKKKKDEKKIDNKKKDKEESTVEHPGIRPLSAFGNMIQKKTDTHIIIDLGATRTSLILWADNMIKFTASPQISGLHMTKVLEEKMKLTTKDAEKTKRICGLDPKKCKGKPAKVLDQSIDEIAAAVAEMVSFYESHFPETKSIDSIMLCGGGAHLINIEDILFNKTTIPVSIGNPYFHISDKKKGLVIPQAKQQSFTTAVGLALRGII